jgi:hypothetical protein
LLKTELSIHADSTRSAAGVVTTQEWRSEETVCVVAKE